MSVVRLLAVVAVSVSVSNGSEAAEAVVNNSNSVILSKTNIDSAGAWNAYVNPNHRNGAAYDRSRVVNFFAGTGGIGDMHTTDNKQKFLVVPYQKGLWQPTGSIQNDTVGINFNGSGYTRLFFPTNPNKAEKMGESYALIKENKGFGVYVSGGNNSNADFLPPEYGPYLFQKTWTADGSNNQDVSISVNFEENELNLAPFSGTAKTMQYQISNLIMQTAQRGGDMGRCRFDFSIKFECVHSSCHDVKGPKIQVRPGVIGSRRLRQAQVGQAAQVDAQTPYNLEIPQGATVLKHEDTGPVVASNHGDATIFDVSEVPSNVRNFDVKITFSQFKVMLREIAKVQILVALEEGVDVPDQVVDGSDEDKAIHWWGNAYTARGAWKVSGIASRMEVTQHSKNVRTACGGSYEEIRVDRL